MSRHRYPRAALRADHLRGGGGLAVTGGPLALLPMHWLVAGAFGTAAAVFALFLARTVQRQLTVITVDEDGIAARGPLGTAIRWDELTGLRLRWFSTRREPPGRGDRHGWMELRLTGRGRSLVVDSTLDGFTELTGHAVAAARARGLPLSETTRDNLVALGLGAAADRPEPRWDLAGLDPARPLAPRTAPADAGADR